MACRSGKIGHPTRDAALTHMRELEYKNSLHGHDLLSVGLSAYPCRECGHWHVGRRHVPTVWHYDTVAVLHAMTDTVALTPEKPRRLSTRARRRHTGSMLALLLHFEEHASMVWFTWNETWDFSCAPHPGVFVSRSVAQRPGEGVVRIGVPASVITLRWRDYVQRNGEPRAMAKRIAQMDRADWLATEQPVPFRLVRSMEAWYRGVWVDARTLDDDFDRWLAEPLAE
jgi:hypothetical protein